MILLLACGVVGCGEPPAIVVEPLQVVSWVPNQGAQCVAAAAADFEAAVTFSDDIEPDSLTGESLFVRPEGGDALVVALGYDKASQTARVTVQADLLFDAVYELVATDAIRGAERGHLVTELQSSFITISPAGCF